MARILVIDDNPAIRQVLQCCLPGFGHLVSVAEDGPEGLLAATVESTDLILIDVDMPLMDGITVCETLKRDPMRRHIPVLIMTGRPTHEIRRLAFDAGAMAVLSKPFTWEVLLEEFSRHLPAGV
jgi:CheY-like chemotaxis protein